MKGDKTMFENQLGLQEQLDVMKQYGIIFDTGAPIRGILANDSIDQLANDAAMVTAANSGIPVEFTSYIDPMVIPILTATRGAREIFGEAKKGDWTTSYARFQTSEITGEVEAYTDYGQGGASDVNPTFPVRTQYIYQTNIRYGDREVDVASRARLQLAADKQRAAATVIDIASNKFALYGVAGWRFTVCLTTRIYLLLLVRCQMQHPKLCGLKNPLKKFTKMYCICSAKWLTAAQDTLTLTPNLCLLPLPLHRYNLAKQLTSISLHVRCWKPTSRKSVSLHCLNWLPQLAALPFSLSLRQSKDCRPLKSDLAKNSALCA